MARSAPLVVIPEGDLRPFVVIPEGDLRPFVVIPEGDLRPFVVIPEGDLRPFVVIPEGDLRLPFHSSVPHSSRPHRDEWEPTLSPPRRPDSLAARNGVPTQ